jgi:hypothetical protein
MPRSNAEKTREFRNRMRTQGAAGFAAGPWQDVEESLGMDQSVVVDQDGNPVWSVQHTRKPRHALSRSGFDRLLGGVAALATATLLTSVLAIYFEQTREPGEGGLLAGGDTATDTDGGNTITLLRPSSAGFIDRPAIEVVENSVPDRDIMQGTLDTGEATATGDNLTGMAEAGSVQGTASADPIATAETTGADTTTIAAMDEADEAAASLPESHALDSSAAAQNPAEPVDALSSLGPDTAEAIEAITLQESPAAIGGPTASTGMAGEAAAVTSPAAITATAGQTSTADAIPAVIEPPAGPDMTVSTSAPVGAATPRETTTLADAGPVVTAAAMESPGQIEPASPDPAAADMMADTSQVNPAAETGAVSATDTQATGATQLARLEPATPSASTDSAVTAEPGETAAVTMDDVPLPGETGRWIINLASYNGPKTASRMQRKFEALGVSTDKQVAEVNGKTMYRLRIASFESRRDAEAYFDSIKGTLGLESAWITKK